MLMLAVLAAALADPALAGAAQDRRTPVSGAVLEQHARRGATLERLDGLAGESAPACAAVCDTRPACQAWTWRMGWSGRAARCDLHGAAATPVPHPGAVTGLSAGLAARIDAASDRPPSARERKALSQADGAPGSAAAPAAAGAGELAGG